MVAQENQDLSNEEAERELQVIDRRIDDLSNRYRQLKEERDRVTSELEEVQHTLSNYQGVKADLQRVLGKEVDRSATELPEDLSQLTIRDAAILILQQQQPRSTSEITDQLQNRGKDSPRNSVLGTLQRHDDLFEGEREGRDTVWTLTDKAQSKTIG